jgi:hypothetical protein
VIFAGAAFLVRVQQWPLPARVHQKPESIKNPSPSKK